MTAPTTNRIDISSSAAPWTREHAANLLGRWNIKAIGRGDEVAGLNTLVGLCSILSNVAGPGTAIVDKSGERLEAGIDSITVGAGSTDLLRQLGLNPLADLQSRLVETAAELVKLDKLHAEIEAPLPPARRKQSPEMSALERKFHDPTGLHASDDPAELLLDHEPSLMEEVKKSPLFFLEGSSTEILNKNLPRTHLGYPYVCLSPDGVAHFADVLSTLEAFAGGRQLDSGRTIRGRTSILTHMDVLEDYLQASGSGLARRILVLSDLPSPRPLAGPDAGTPPRIGQRFEAALLRTLVARLHGPGTFITEAAKLRLWPRESIDTRQHELCDWQPALERIRKALQKDANLPHEAFAIASRLFASLVFGLMRLSRALNKPIPDAVMGVASLTIFLVRRSVHSVRTLAMKGKLERMNRLCSSLLERLHEGTHTARKLTRRHNRLSMADCREALGMLINAGHVSADGPLDGSRTRFSIAVEAESRTDGPIIQRI